MSIAENDPMKILVFIDAAKKIDKYQLYAKESIRLKCKDKNYKNRVKNLSQLSVSPNPSSEARSHTHQQDLGCGKSLEVLA